MAGNINDSFSDGFNTNDTEDRAYDSYDGYDGYNGRCIYDSVTYASNSYDVNKRNYNSQIITNTEFQYMWDRLNAQQSKFGTSQVSRPSVGVGTVATAAQANKEALAILTISDSLLTHEETTAEERQTSFTNMMKVALDCIK